MNEPTEMQLLSHGAAYYFNECQKLTDERDQLRQRVAELEAALGEARLALDSRISTATALVIRERALGAIDKALTTPAPDGKEQQP